MILTAFLVIAIVNLTGFMSNLLLIRLDIDELRSARSIGMIIATLRQSVIVRGSLVALVGLLSYALSGFIVGLLSGSRLKDISSGAILGIMVNVILGVYLVRVVHVLGPTYTAPSITTEALFLIWALALMRRGGQLGFCLLHRDSTATSANRPFWPRFALRWRLILLFTTMLLVSSLITNYWLLSHEGLLRVDEETRLRTVTANLQALEWQFFTMFVTGVALGFWKHQHVKETVVAGLLFVILYAVYGWKAVMPKLEALALLNVPMENYLSNWALIWIAIATGSDLARLFRNSVAMRLLTK